MKFELEQEPTEVTEESFSSPFPLFPPVNKPKPNSSKVNRTLSAMMYGVVSGANVPK